MMENELTHGMGVPRQEGSSAFLAALPEVCLQVCSPQSLLCLEPSGYPNSDECPSFLKLS